MSKFESFFDYLKFVALVRNTNRYLFHSLGHKFLETLLATSESRKVRIAKETFLWRSQLGMADPRQVIWEEGVYEDSSPKPYSAERMKPRINMASEGRANPKGIPYLYLSTDRDTAMAECRPWLHSYVSVGQFQTTRDLILVDCSKNEYIPVGINEIKKEKTDSGLVEKVIWGQINKAFTKPVAPSDFTADYSPTQAIAEFFKSKDFDGIKYQSSLGSGHNIAIFDLNAAELTHRYLFKPKTISYSFEAVKDAHYGTYLGEYLDNPEAVDKFMENIKNVLKKDADKKESSTQKGENST